MHVGFSRVVPRIFSMYIIQILCNIYGYSMTGQDDSTLSVVRLLVNVLSINLADKVNTLFGLLIKGSWFK